MALVDRVRGRFSDIEWAEFKRRQCAPEQLGQYLSALANSACLAGQPKGYLLLGIEDGTGQVAGTDFQPHTAKGAGNRDLLPWIGAGLQPNPGFDVHVVDHPKGRVVVFEVASAEDQPVSFYGTEYVRVGSVKTELSKYPEMARMIWTQELDWSAQLCDRAGLSALESAALAQARERYLEGHSGQKHEIQGWDDLTFLEETRLFRDGVATNAALLLLGRPESAGLLMGGVAWLFWILKDADNRPLHSANVRLPFLDAGDRIVKRISRNLPVRFLPKRSVLTKEFAQYDPAVICEAVHNAIAHQDYYQKCRICVVEFPDRLIVSNAGRFLPGDVETAVRRNSSGTRSRNPFLADTMRLLGIIESRGRGIRKMFETQRERFFPLPDYDLTEFGHVEMTIHGRLFGEAYSRLLMERPDLSLEQVMLLDRVQKGLTISSDDHLELEGEGLVRDAHPHHVIADPNLDVTAPSANIFFERSPPRMSGQFYVDLVVAVIVKHGPVGRTKIDEVLMRELPQDLTDDEKRTRIRNHIQDAQRAGRIVNVGSGPRTAWVHARAKRTKDGSAKNSGGAAPMPERIA